MGKVFFHQGYAAISRILVYLFNVFLLILDLRRVCERLCEFCVQCKKLSGSKVFFFLHQVTTEVEMLKSVSP